MANSRIHIDHLFAKGLENLEIPLVSNAFETIKKELLEKNTSDTPFKNFEIAVTDEDWLILKERLSKAMLQTTAQPLEKSLKELELAVTDNDWLNVKEKLAQKDNSTFLPLSSAPISSTFKDFEIAVTDSDWQATKSKLNDFRSKKMIWWWWLNIAVIGSLIGLLFNHYTPLSNTNAPLTIAGTSVQTEVSQPIASELGGKNNTADKKHKLQTTESAAKKETKTQEGITYKPQKNFGIVSNTSKSTSHYSANSSQKSSAQEVNTIMPKYSNGLVGVKQVGNADAEKNHLHVANEPMLKEEIEPKINNAQVSPNVVLNSVKDPTAISTETPKDVQTVTVDANGIKINAIDTPKKKTQVTPVTPPPPPSSRLLVYAGLVTDMSIGYRHLSKDNDERYNEIRNNADKKSFQFSYGFTAGVQKGSNQFQSGLQISQQTFNSSYNYITKYQDSLPYRNSAGDILFYFPIGPYKERNIKESTHVTIQRIDIPFLYNKVWSLDQKTQLTTGFGGMLGMNIKTEGNKMLNPANNELYTYNYLKGAEKKLSFSPNLSIGLQRELKNNFMLQVNLTGKYSVTNRYDPNFQAKQYPYSNKLDNFTAKEYLYSYGLSIKLLYLINK